MNQIIHMEQNNKMNEKKEEMNCYHWTKMQKDMIFGKLRERGCRITNQRKVILDIILQHECVCCKEIHYRAAKKDSGIGKATVYRMLNQLEELGAISRKDVLQVESVETCIQDSKCKIVLQSGEELQLSESDWKEVFQAGLKACGYIKQEEVHRVDLLK